MPLPFVIVVGAGLAGLSGAKKGIKSISDNRTAVETMMSMQSSFNQQKIIIKNKRNKTVKSLEKYAELKLEILDNQFGKFVDNFSKIKNIELQDNVIIKETSNRIVKEVSLLELKDISLKAGEIISAGAKALGAGALSGLAATGGVTMLASASTGTAIASLSGVAATNATLAWFGGGSLATGGLGVAGGTAILGGIIVGPIIAVGGSILASKAKENLVEARRIYSEAQVAIEEMKKACIVLDAIDNYTNKFNSTANKLNMQFDKILSRLGYIVKTKVSCDRYIDFQLLNDGDKKCVHLAYEYAQTIKIILQTPLMKEDGAPNDDCEKILQISKRLING